MNILDLEKLKADFVYELSVGGLVWEYAIMSGFIHLNDDGSNSNSQTEYLETFNIVHQINNENIIFKNKFDDYISVPLSYIYDPESRFDMETKILRRLRDSVEKAEAIEQEKLNKINAISKINDIASENNVDVIIK